MVLRIILFLTFVFTIEISVLAESFTDFDAKISMERNIRKLRAYHSQELEKYYTTKNVYYLYNSKYIEAAIAGVNDNINERIRILCWISEQGKNSNSLQITWVNYHVAAMLTFVNAPALSQEYSFKVLNSAKENGFNALLPLSYGSIGSNYYKEKKFNLAIKYYTYSLEINKKISQLQTASMYNNIALCNMNLNKYKKAYADFLKSYQILKQIKNKSKGDIDFMNVVQGNIGTMLNKLGKYNEAIDLLEKEIDYYSKNNSNNLSVQPLIELLGLYDRSNQKEKLNEVIVKMVSLEKESANKNTFPILTEALYNFYLKKGDTQRSVTISKRLFKLQKDYSNSIMEQSSFLNDILHRVKLRHLKKEIQTKNQLLNLAIKEKRYSQVLSVSLAVVVLLTVLIVVIVLRSKKKNKVKDDFIQEQQKQLEIKRNIILENEVKLQQEKITNLALNLNLKKSTEQAFLTKLNELKRKKNIGVEQVIKDLQLSVSNLLNIDKKLVHDTIETEDINRTFKAVLANLYPKLSKSDLDYCCYFRLNLSAKEIGSIHGISDVSVRVLKNKIKKNIGLSADQSLNDYLINLPVK